MKLVALVVLALQTLHYEALSLTAIPEDFEADQDACLFMLQAKNEALSLNSVQQPGSVMANANLAAKGLVEKIS